MSQNQGSATQEIPFAQDLLHVAKRVPKPSQEQLRIEGWRGSWLSRLAEVLVGRDREEKPQNQPG